MFLHYEMTFAWGSYNLSLLKTKNRKVTKVKRHKHRVTIPCKWSFDFTWNPPDSMKSARFHEICMESGRFHVKSTQNLIKANVSTKTIQFDECRRGAMTLDFMKSGVIAPSMHPPKLKSFCWNIWFYKVLGGFHEIHWILWMWAFAWWSSIGLSFERPIKLLRWHILQLL